MIRSENEVFDVVPEEVLFYIKTFANRYRFLWRNLILREVSRKFPVNGNTTRLISLFEKEGFIDYTGELTKVEPNRFARQLVITVRGMELLENFSQIIELLEKTNKKCNCSTGKICGNCMANNQLTETMNKKNGLFYRTYKVNKEAGIFISKVIADN